MASLDTPDRNLISITKTSTLHMAVLGTPFEYDTTIPLTAAWKGCGYLGEGAPSATINRSMEDIKVHGDVTIAKIPSSGNGASFDAPIIETRPHVVEAIFGGPVDTANGTYVEDPNKLGLRLLWCHSRIDLENDNVIREFFEGQAVGLGSRSYVTKEVVTLDTTFEIFGGITVSNPALKASAEV